MQFFAMMQSLGGAQSNEDYMAAAQGINQQDNESDEEYISDEEFQKGLTEQEKTIFNALVISINQTHM